MIVWLKDLKSNWLSWLAISITMLVSSASCSLAISMISADGKDAIPLGGTILGMSICAIVLVTFSQMRLTIEEHQPIYQSWRMVGMPGWMINLLILGQVAVVSATASLIGAQLIRPALSPAVKTLRGDGIPMPELSVDASVVMWVVLACGGAAIAGALLPLRQIFRSQTDSHPLWITVRSAVATVAIAGCSIGGASIEKTEDVLAWAMGMSVLIPLLLPWLLPLLDQWTRVLGIAGANVRVRRNFSSPHIVPWVLFGSLIIGVGSGLRLIKDAEPGSSMSAWQVFVVVLGPVFAPSIAGAVTTSLIMHARIKSDIRGLRLAGAPGRSWILIQIGEAFALTGTAALVVLVFTVLTVGIVNDHLTGFVSFHGIWWTAFGSTFAAMFLALCSIKLAVASSLETNQK
jgi:hypothetical protein